MKLTIFKWPKKAPQQKAEKKTKPEGAEGQDGDGAEEEAEDGADADDAGDDAGSGEGSEGSAGGGDDADDADAGAEGAESEESEAIGNAIAAMNDSLEAAHNSFAEMMAQVSHLEARLGKLEGSRTQEVREAAKREAAGIAAEAGVPEGGAPATEGAEGKPANAEAFHAEYQRLKKEEGRAAASKYYRQHEDVLNG